MKILKYFFFFSSIFLFVFLTLGLSSKALDSDLKIKVIETYSDFEGWGAPCSKLEIYKDGVLYKTVIVDQTGYFSYQIIRRDYLTGTWTYKIINGNFCGQSSSSTSSGGEECHGYLCDCIGTDCVCMTDQCKCTGPDCSCTGQNCVCNPLYQSCNSSTTSNSSHSSTSSGGEVCTGYNCQCTGSDCECLTTGCQCIGPDCDCVGSGCHCTSGGNCTSTTTTTNSNTTNTSSSTSSGDDECPEGSVGDDCGNEESSSSSTSSGGFIIDPNTVLPPSININKQYFKPEQQITVFGKTVPNATVTIYFSDLDSPVTVNSDSRGRYTFTRDVGPIGEYNVYARTTFKGIESKRSTILYYYVNTTGINPSSSSTSSGGIFPKITDPIIDIIKKIFEPTRKFITNTFTPIFTIIVASELLLFLANILALLSSNLSMLPRLFIYLLNLIGIIKPKKPWGIVFDAVNKKPISLATIYLFSYETNDLVKSITSDLNGKFGFVVSSGKYYIRVSHSDYNFPSEYYSLDKVISPDDNLYFGQVFIISQDEKALNFNIPLDPKENISSLQKLKINFRNNINTFRFLYTFKASFIFFILSLIILLYNQTIFNLSTVILYSVLLLFAILKKIRQPKAWGVVKDSNTGNPIKFSFVRIFDKQTKDLVDTQVTDEKGRFQFFTEPAAYNILISAEGYSFPSQFDKTRFEYEPTTNMLTSNNSDKFLNMELFLDPARMFNSTIR